MNSPVSAEALQHFLSAYATGMKDFFVPEDPFDPTGSWKKVYRIWSVQPRMSPKQIDGYLTIQRQPRDNGIALEVQQQTIMHGTGAGPVHSRPFSYWQKASIQCQNNRWSTPQRWTAETWGTDQDGKVEAITQIKFSAQFSNGQITFPDRGKPAVSVGTDWTLDWALMDALQRIATPQNSDLTLDIIEDLGALRPNQRLAFISPFQAKLVGKSAELYGFCRVGTGTLPGIYLLDMNHRLLFVMHNLRAYILQPKM